MAIINTGLLTKGLRSEFFQRLGEIAPATFFGKLCTTIPSNADQETYRHLGQVPNMREWGTGRKANGLNVEAYTVANLKYESTLEVDRDEISDDQTGQIRLRVNDMAQRAATHKDYLLSQLLINGSTAGFHSSDGVPFFDAAHSFGSSGSQDNEIDFDISASVTAYGEPDDVDLVGPRTAAAGIGKAFSTMATFLDDQAQPINLGMTGLVVMCHPQQVFAFMTATGSAELNHVSNPMASMRIEVIPNPWLTDVSQWYLFKTDMGLKPFIFQDREPLEFTAQAEGSSEEFHREKYYYGVRARYRLTYGRWAHAVSVNFTT